MADGSRPELVGTPQYAVSQLRVLGPISARRADGTSVSMRSALRRRLLGLLLAAHGELVSADRLADELWFEEPPLGRGALHVQICRLRKDLGLPDGHIDLVAVASGYRISCHLGVLDSEVFLESLATASAESEPRRRSDVLCSALGLWRDDAFTDVRGTPLIDQQAAFLDARRGSATNELADLYLAIDEPAAALSLASTVLARTPYDESMAASAARALCRLGRTAEALDVVERTVRAVFDDLGVRPAAAFLELRDDIRDRPDHLMWREPVRTAAVPAPAGRRGASALPVVESAVPLMGRDETLQRLEQVTTGRTASVLIEVVGPGGFGKTRTLVTFAQNCRSAGVSVRYGRGDAGRRTVAGAIYEMFGDVVPDRLQVEVVPDVARELADALISEIVHALRTADDPVVLVLDDLHATDTVDRLVLDGLLAAESVRLAVVAGSRHQGVLTSVPAEVLELAPMEIDDIESTVGSRGLAEQLVGLTAGHPMTTALAVAEVLRVPEHERHQVLRRIEAGHGAAQTTLTSLLGGIDHRSAEVLVYLAASAAPVRPSTIAMAAGQREETIAGSLGELIAAGLVIEVDGGDVVVAHDLLGEAARRHFGPLRIDEATRRLLRLAAAGEDRVPRISTGGGEHHVELLLLAGNAALAGAAYDEALRISELIRSLGADDVHAPRTALLEGVAASALGDRNRAAENLQAAWHGCLATGDDRGAVDSVLAQLGAWNRGSGPRRDQIDLIERTLAAVHQPAPRAALLARAVSLFLGRDERCDRWARESFALAQEAGDAAALAAATSAIAYAGFGRPGTAARLGRTTAAVRALTPDIGFERYASLVSCHFVLACECGAIDELDWCVEQQRVIGRTTRRPVHRWRAEVLDAAALLVAGRLDDAAAAIERGAELAAEFRLADGVRTERLQRAALFLWGGPLPSFVDEGVVLGSELPHPLTHALDASMLDETDKDRSAWALGQATAMLPSLPRDYLWCASVVAVHHAARRLGDDAALERVRALVPEPEVVVPVVAVATTAFPPISDW